MVSLFLFFICSVLAPSAKRGGSGCLNMSKVSDLDKKVSSYDNVGNISLITLVLMLALTLAHIEILD